MVTNQNWCFRPENVVWNNLKSKGYNPDDYMYMYSQKDGKDVFKHAMTRRYLIIEQ